MKKRLRNTSTLPPLTPEGSTSTAQNERERTDRLTKRVKALTEENAALRLSRSGVLKMLSVERARHATIETLFVRMTNQLEQQVSDLRIMVIPALRTDPTFMGEKQCQTSTKA